MSFMEQYQVQLGSLGSTVSSPAGSGAQPQQKSNVMRFSLKIWHLAAPIFHFPWLSPKKISPDLSLTTQIPFFQFSLTCRNPVSWAMVIQRLGPSLRPRARPERGWVREGVAPSRGDGAGVSPLENF